MLLARASAAIAACLCLATLVSSCVFGGRTLLQPEKNGHAVYAEACASCHGIGGRGDGPAAGALRRRPADLTRLAEANGGSFPRQRLFDILTGAEPIEAHGNREMPVWNQKFLPPSTAATATGSIYMRRHLERVVSYVESIQRAQPPSTFDGSSGS